MFRPTKVTCSRYEFSGGSVVVNGAIVRLPGEAGSWVARVKDGMGVNVAPPEGGVVDVRGGAVRVPAVI